MYIIILYKIVTDPGLNAVFTILLFRQQRVKKILNASLFIYTQTFALTLRFCFFLPVVLRKLHQEFLHSLFTSNIEWSCIQPEAGSRITERYSHSCCYHDKSLYVFGGCTSTNTTLNDLWRFDLSTREWIRPLAMGNHFKKYIFKLMLTVKSLWRLPPNKDLFQVLQITKSYFFLDRLLCKSYSVRTQKGCISA